MTTLDSGASDFNLSGDRSEQAMRQQRGGPTRRGFWLDEGCMFDVTRGEARQRGQRANAAREAMAGQYSDLVELSGRPPLPNLLAIGKQPSGDIEQRVARAKQPGGDGKQSLSPPPNTLQVRLLVEERRPAILKVRELGSTNPAQ